MLEMAEDPFANLEKKYGISTYSDSSIIINYEVFKKIIKEMNRLEAVKKLCDEAKRKLSSPKYGEIFVIPTFIAEIRATAEGKTSV